MADSVVWNVGVKIFSPLHIGNGNALLRDYDYAVHGGYTWRLNVDALLDERADDPAIQDRLARTPPAQLLLKDDFRAGSPYFLYVLRGEPRSSEPGAQIQEQLKDAWQRPYLPGSSLKGAIRTALLCHALSGRHGGLDLAGLGDNARYAAAPLEQGAFGRSPNEDLLRALQVADGEPLPPDCLTIVHCQVVPAASLAVPAPRRFAGSQRGNAGPGAPIEVEAIRAGTEFTCRLKVDRALFGAWAQRAGLTGHPGRDWLEELPHIIQAHTQQRVARIRQRWQRSGENPALSQFFDMVARDREGTCFVQVGWGSGWDGKTVGALLDDRQVDAIVTRYRLSRSRERRPGEPFPASRRMALDRQGRVAGPPGWLRLDFRRPT